MFIKLDKERSCPAQQCIQACYPLRFGSNTQVKMKMEKYSPELDEKDCASPTIVATPPAFLCIMKLKMQ